VRSDHYENPRFDSVPRLEAVATIDDERDTLTLFAVNRSQDGPLELEGDLRFLDGYRVVEHVVLEHSDPKASNGAGAPDMVVPHGRGDASLHDGTLTATLPRLSWNVIRVARA
jgi:alpha-L-arabinofuranosidase